MFAANETNGIMQTISSVLAGILLSLHLLTQSGSDPLTGKWTSDDKSRVIEFVKNGNAYDALIREADDKTLIGKKQIAGLTTRDGKSFKNGTLFLIKKGKTAKCSARVLDGRTLELTGSVGLLSKSETWTKL